MRLITAIAAATCCATLAGQEPTITARIDPRVELMSVIFRLAGAPEYNEGKVARYTAAVEQRFREFEQHPAVRKARELRRRRGVSHDAVAELAIHVTPPPALRELIAFVPRPPSLGARWRPDEARDFLDAARQFAEQTRFTEFLSEQEALFTATTNRMQDLLDRACDLDWFSQFFGARPSASFELVLGMLNGGRCYGPRLQAAEGNEVLYCVLGVWQTDPQGIPTFDESMIGTVIHEFCHSYCNRLIDDHFTALERSADTLFGHVGDLMRSQAYADSTTMMYESLVRACVIRYLLIHEGISSGKHAAQRDADLGFYWVNDLTKLLGRYEANRADHPTLDSFMPEVSSFFESWTASYEERRARAPTVVSIVPRNGADDVDPTASAVVITFDRPMRDSSWSFVGGGPSFPKVTGQPSYDADLRVLTLPVTLKPGWSYEFWLNRGRHRSFQSSDGVALDPVHVLFKTRAARR